MSGIQIPQNLLPRDGRFGAGPSRLRPEALDDLLEHRSILGTSHRQAPVRELVGDIRTGLHEFFRLPSGYEVVLGNGGSTALWDGLAASVISRRSAHLSFGEFGGKFVASASAPWLEDPHVVTTEPGSRGELSALAGVDVYAWPHNETSTGVSAPVARVAGADPDSLVVIDATSAAGGIEVEMDQCDIYYFAPQKNFASDGGLWWALMSEAALARIEDIHRSSRFIPPFLSLQAAVENSRSNQTLNTPALATLLLMRSQLEWMNGLGGLGACAERTKASSDFLYAWAEAHALLSPFVVDPTHRSPVIVTIDIDPQIDAAALISTMRANGVVDIDSYRKLGRNQIRIATFVATDLSEVQALAASIDYVLERLAT